MEQRANEEVNWWACSGFAVVFFLLTYGHYRLMAGFVSIKAGVILAVIGAFFGAMALSSLAEIVTGKRSWLWGILLSLVSGVIATVTLIPCAPESVLLKVPLGWNMLDHRKEQLDDAINEKDLSQVRRLALAGIGDPEPRDSFGNPLLSYIREPELLQALLEGGLDPDVRGEREDTLLMNTHDVDMTRLLLEHGAKPNLRDREGRSALMFANAKDTKIRDLLLEYGADVHAVDDHGRPVMDYFQGDPSASTIFGRYAGGRELVSTDVPVALVGREDWLDRRVTDGHVLPPSSIEISPDPIHYGDLGEVSVRLTNETEEDRVIKVTLNMNSPAMFVDATHRGSIANPYQRQLDQEITWPQLALPAQSSGLVQLRVKIRPDFDAGDLTLDVRADDMSRYDDDSAIFLNRYESLTERSGGGQLSLVQILLVALFPGVLIAWILAFRFARKNAVTNVLGRVAAGLFAWVFAMMTLQLANDLIDPYTSFEQAQATILDKRFILQSSTSKDSRGYSRTTLHKVPITCVSFNTPQGQVIAASSPDGSHPGGEGDLDLGAEVDCWYDPQEPDRFVLARGVGPLHVIVIPLLVAVTLVLLWVVFRRRRR